MPKYNYVEPAWVEQFLKADREGRLSSKDRKVITKLRSDVKFSPAEEASNMATELDPANLLSLEQELSRQTDPAIIQILSDEKNNVMRLVAEANKIKAAQNSKQQEEPQEASFIDQITNFLQSIFSSKESK